MKKLLLVLAFPLALFGQNPIETSVHELGRDLQTEFKEEGIFSRIKKDILRMKTTRKVRKHMDHNFDKYTAKVHEAIEAGVPSDVLKDLLTQLFGEEIANILIQLTALPEVEKRLTGLVTDWKLLMSGPTCPEGVKKVVGHLAFLGAVAAVAIYAPPPFQFLAVHAGVIAGEAAELIIEATNANTALCGLIYSEKYGRFSYAY